MAQHDFEARCACGNEWRVRLGVWVLVLALGILLFFIILFGWGPS